MPLHFSVPRLHSVFRNCRTYLSIVILSIVILFFFLFSAHLVSRATILSVVPGSGVYASGDDQKLPPLHPPAAPRLWTQGIFGSGGRGGVSPPRYSPFGGRPSNSPPPVGGFGDMMFNHPGSPPVLQPSTADGLGGSGSRFRHSTMMSPLMQQSPSRLREAFDNSM